MHESNVRGAERVLDTAVDAGVKQIVYVSTVSVFGQHPARSSTRATSTRAMSFSLVTRKPNTCPTRSRSIKPHRKAPIGVIQHGGVYGPAYSGSPSNFIDQTSKGKLKILMLPELGFNLVHVDVSPKEFYSPVRGQVGEGYVLGGEIDDEEVDREGRRARDRRHRRGRCRRSR